MKSKQEQRGDVRNALEGLNEVLETQFAEGRIWYEADIHQVVLSHLTRRLVAKDERWIIGSEHWVDDVRPDVVCYYRTGKDYAEFLCNSDDAIVAIVEIKFASALGADLTKLEKVAANRQVLTWMIYGDHFDEGLHSSNFAKQLERAEAIDQWKSAGRSRMRGSTILKCGELSAKSKSCRDALSAINEGDRYWHKRKRGVLGGRGGQA